MAVIAASLALVAEGADVEVVLHEPALLAGAADLVRAYGPPSRPPPGPYGEYTWALLAHFGWTAARPHPAVAALDEGHLYYDRYFSVQAPSWTARFDAELRPRDGAVDPSWVVHAGHLRAFGIDAGWGDFARTMAGLHDGLRDRTARALDPGWASEVEAYLGVDVARWVVAVAPAMGSSGRADLVPTRDGAEVWLFVNPLHVASNAALAVDLARSLSVFASVELATEAVVALDLGASFYRPRRWSGKRRPLTPGVILPPLGEAIACRLRRARYGDDVGAACVAGAADGPTRSAGPALLVPVLYEALATYEADRARWPTFADFAPTLLEVFDALEAQGDDTWWAESAWSRAARPWPGPWRGGAGPERERWLREATTVVLPPGGPLRDHAIAIAERVHGGRVAEALPDDGDVFVYGTADGHPLLAAWADDLPFSVSAEAIAVGGGRVTGTGLRLVAFVPRPDGRGWAGIVTGQDERGVLAADGPGAGFGYAVRAEDGALCLSGTFGPDPERAPVFRERACPLVDEPVHVPEMAVVPPRWPAELPRRATPSAFGAVVDEALAGCGLALERVEITCDAPPCLALLRPTGEDFWVPLVERCAPWIQAYGRGATLAEGEAACGERYVVLGPPLPAVAEDLGVPVSLVSASVSARWRALIDAWPCPDGSP